MERVNCARVLHGGIYGRVYRREVIFREFCRVIQKIRNCYVLITTLVGRGTMASSNLEYTLIASIISDLLPHVFL